MSTLKTLLNDALLGFIKDYDSTAVEVVSYEDRTEYGGYCETCEYEYAVVDIEYLDDEGNRQRHTFTGGFSELIGLLT